MLLPFVRSPYYLKLNFKREKIRERKFDQKVVGLSKGLVLMDSPDKKNENAFGKN